MSTLRFTDGVNIDTSGPYRTMRLHDGWYVTGHGLLMPCCDEQEAIQERDRLLKS
jgi:hypothetical protein